MNQHTCEDCGENATHIVRYSIDGDTCHVSLPRSKWKEEEYFCQDCAREHYRAVPLPTRSDAEFDQGLDDWQEG